MAEKPTGAGEEPCQRVLLCPLCKVTQSRLCHLTEHLKKVHKPLAELGPSSKRDRRLRLSPKQKEELTKAIRENRYKSTEYKYALIHNIAAPESPIPTDKVLPPSGEVDVKSPTPVPQSWNLHEYFRDHTETTHNMFLVLEESGKEAVIQHFEELLDTLRIAAANAKGATQTGSPHHPGLVPTTPHPTPTYPFPNPDPPISGLITFEASFCPSNSSNQTFVAFGSTVEQKSPEWPEDVAIDPRLFELED